LGPHIVEQYGGDEEKWRAFLAEAENKEGTTEAISRFLLAVRDRCLAYGQYNEVPGFVVPELERRAGLDPKVIEKARLAQRVPRLISDLSPFCAGHGWARDRERRLSPITSGPSAPISLSSFSLPHVRAIRQSIPELGHGSELLRPAG